MSNLQYACSCGGRLLQVSWRLWLSVGEFVDALLADNSDKNCLEVYFGGEHIELFPILPAPLSFLFLYLGYKC
jgi:hypothetical protein